MSLSQTLTLRGPRLAALMSVGLALTASVASAHVAVIRNSAKLQGNDYAVVNPNKSTGGAPVRIQTQKGVGVTTRNYGDKTVISFDKPVAAAGTYFSAVGGTPTQASIEAYDKSGRKLKLWDEGTRRLQVTQWTTVRPGGAKATTFMGVRSCCACIKQIVVKRPPKPFQVAVETRQPRPVAPKPMIASRPATPMRIAKLPPAPVPVPVAPSIPTVVPPVAVASGGGGGGGFFPLVLPLAFSRSHHTEFVNNVSPPVPPLTPETPCIPEPSAIALAIPGLLPLLALHRRRRKKAVGVEE